jgi:hypothetical protein
LRESVAPCPNPENMFNQSFGIGARHFSDLSDLHRPLQPDKACELRQKE